MRRARAVTVTAALLAVLTSGCTGGRVEVEASPGAGASRAAAPGADPSSSTGGSGAGDEPTGQAGDDVALDTGWTRLEDRSALVLYGCVLNELTGLVAVDPASGEELGRFTLPAASGAAPLPQVGCGGGGFGSSRAADRALFDAALHTAASTLRDPATDAVRAGTLDLTSLAWNDAGEDQGEAFGRGRRESEPLFQPGTRRLWYRDRDAEIARSLDLASGQRREEAVPDPEYGWLVAADGQVYSVPPNGLVLPSPDGERAVYDESATHPVLTRGPAPQFSEQRRFGDLPGWPYADDLGTTCEPELWVDARRLLCRVANYDAAPVTANLVVLTFAADFASIERTTPLLPDGDRDNSSPVLSPDGTTIAFISRQGEAAEVFTVDVEGATPALRLFASDPLADPVLDGFQLLEWR